MKPWMKSALCILHVSATMFAVWAVRVWAFPALARIEGADEYQSGEMVSAMVCLSGCVLLVMLAVTHMAFVITSLEEGPRK